MTRRRKNILIFVVIVIVGVAVWIAYLGVRTLGRIREAYAAWDTGTLLVDYMKQHDDRWPKSWDDLISTVGSGSGEAVMFRGASAGDVDYARSLKDQVTVDWSFDPAHPGAQTPVTRKDGQKFPMVWSGAEPNEMVRSYLAERASTRPTAPH